MNKKLTKERILFFIILLIGILVRVIKWPNMIELVHLDEAMTAINAKTIAEQGIDMYGTTYPVFFETWKWGGQTAVLTYLMALAIKILGFNMIAIRMPTLIVSILSIVIIYLLTNKLFHNKKMALIAMFLTAISPWHILQSLFALDCNMFPHVTLFAVFLLCNGIEENKRFYLYLSMVFFAIAMYTYGLALYFIPLFLLILAIYLLKTKKIKVRDILISIVIYLTISMPILLMYFINFFQLETIKIGQISIPFLPEFQRMSDILIFADNIPSQLCENISNMLTILVLQTDGQVWSAIPFFGATYCISLIFLVYGIYYYFCKKKRDIKDTSAIPIIYIWILVALGIGISIKELTIYKINIIWYPILILIAFGIDKFLEKIKPKIKYINIIIIVIYLILLVSFFIAFNTNYMKDLTGSTLWDSGLVEAIRYVEDKEIDKVLICDNNIYKFLERPKVFVRFVTNYVIDKYNNEKLEKCDIQYTERYRIINYLEIDWDNLQQYSTYIVPNSRKIYKRFIENGFKPTVYKFYIVFERN